MRKMIIHLMLLSVVIYGLGRAYFQLTAGFLESNIKTDLSQEPDHGLAPLLAEERGELQKILDQPFRYLGKGCQSYVFLSDDGQYVIKFLKYQRFRPQGYLKFISEDQFNKKLEQKKTKLSALLESWKIAYRDLKEETGLVYLHLNRGDHFEKPLVIVDKLGLSHAIDPDEVVFLVQKKAEMLCHTLLKNDLVFGKEVIDRLMAQLLSEYERGLGDNDHALMQNTGLMGTKSLHIDVGQFSKEERFKNPATFKQELFSKTYKFRIWLSKHFPELEQYLTALLQEIIGPEMTTMKTSFKTVDEGA